MSTYHIGKITGNNNVLADKKMSSKKQTIKKAAPTAKTKTVKQFNEEELLKKLSEKQKEKQELFKVAYDKIVTEFNCEVSPLLLYQGKPVALTTVLSPNFGVGLQIVNKQ